MNPNLDVSVVIPVFNGAAFIEDTLASVARQTILPLEIIVVDDGSQDNSCDIVKSFSSSHPQVNIKLLNEKHCGPGAARNAGVTAAAGSWIAFLDSDDLWEPEKLEAMSESYKSAPDRNFLCHNEMHRNLDGKETIVDYSSGYRHDISLQIQLFQRCFFSTSAIICRKNLIVDSGGFDNSFPNAQDYELWLRMSPKIKVLFVPNVLGVYVYRGKNISSRPIWLRHINLCRVFIKHKKLVPKYDYLKRIFLATLFVPIQYIKLLLLRI